MYTKDKAQRITLRVNENQWAFVKECSETLGVSPSDFLRMMLNTAMTEYNRKYHGKEGARRENEQTDLNDRVSGH